MANKKRDLKDGYFSLGGKPMKADLTNPEHILGCNYNKCWPEDFEHENGNYFCNCIKCKEMFIGHKRRVVCKECVDTGEDNESKDNRL